MNLRNLFRKKQVFTATFAGITVTRRGYEHEKEYTWQGQASLFGIDCLLTVTHRTDDEFRNAVVCEAAHHGPGPHALERASEVSRHAGVDIRERA